MLPHRLGFHVEESRIDPDWTTSDLRIRHGVGPLNQLAQSDIVGVQPSRVPGGLAHLDAIGGRLDRSDVENGDGLRHCHRPKSQQQCNFYSYMAWHVGLSQELSNILHR